MNTIKSVGIALLVIVGSLAVLNIETQTLGTNAESPIELGTPTTMHSLQEALINSIEMNTKSVVSVIASKDISYVRTGPFGTYSEEDIRTQRRQVGGGSGILVSEDGYILTNKHVVDDDDTIYTLMFSDGTTADTQDVRVDPLLDVAILRVDPNDIPSGTTPASLLNIEEPVHIGQFTYAIGNSLAEFQNSVTFGIISGKNRELAINEGSVYVGLYQTDTAISMGNSGGPLFNIDGKVIGINTAVSAVGENIGFVLPVTKQFIDATLDQIKQNNEIIRPFLGIRSRFLNTGIAEGLGVEFTQGVYIADVIEDSATDQAGLLEGDVLLSINGREVSETFPLLYQLYTYEPGEEVTLKIGRDGEIIEKKILLGSL